jgi:hypothetical protein
VTNLLHLHGVVDSLISHDFLDTEFAPDKAILDVMDSIFDPKDEMTHQSSCPNLELLRFIMISLDPRLGEFVGVSNRPPSLDHFIPLLYFLELYTDFSATPSYAYFCFVPPSFPYENNQGATIAHKTSHDEYLQPHKFIPM